MNNLEETTKLNLDFNKIRKISSQLVIPVVVQDATSKEVLIIAYTNQQAFQKTLDTKIVTFWSTSKNQLWVKGATSGDYLELIEARVNCEQNSLLYLVIQKGVGVCHTKDKKGKTRKTCFYRNIQNNQLNFRKGFL